MDGGIDSVCGSEGEDVTYSSGRVEEAAHAFLSIKHFISGLDISSLFMARQLGESSDENMTMMMANY